MKRLVVPFAVLAFCVASSISTASENVFNPYFYKSNHVLIGNPGTYSLLTVADTIPSGGAFVLTDVEVSLDDGSELLAINTQTFVRVIVENNQKGILWQGSMYTGNNNGSMFASFPSAHMQTGMVFKPGDPPMLSVGTNSGAHFAAVVVTWSGYMESSLAAMSSTGVSPSPESSLRLGVRTVPNPSRAAVAFELALPKREHVKVTIQDVSGRQVRRLVDAEFAAGSHHMQWDGRDNAGRRVAPGTYLALAVAGRQRGVAKFERIQ